MKVKQHDYNLVVRINRTLKTKAEEKAKLDSMDMSKLVRKLLEQYVMEN